MAIIYSISNQKGGVGKTTTCSCLATALAEQDKKILVVDLDPQGALTISLDFDPETFTQTIYNALISPEEVSLTSIIIKTKISQVDLAPSNLDLAGAEAELIGEIGWDRTLRDILSPISQNYDYILLDCPPSLGVLTTNALMAADRVIIPVQTEYLAMRGLKQLNKIINKVRKKGNSEVKIKILRTMHSTRTLHSTEIVEELKKIFGPQVYDTIIKRTIKFADSTLVGQPILLYAKDSEGAWAYRNLAKEVLKENEQKETNH